MPAVDGEGVTVDEGRSRQKKKRNGRGDFARLCKTLHRDAAGRRREKIGRLDLRAIMRVAIWPGHRTLKRASSPSSMASALARPIIDAFEAQ
jgi:hypothetical protein